MYSYAFVDLFPSHQHLYHFQIFNLTLIFGQNIRKVYPLTLLAPNRFGLVKGALQTNDTSNRDALNDKSRIMWIQPHWLKLDLIVFSDLSISCQNYSLAQSQPIYSLVHQSLLRKQVLRAST